jgi:GWxTD domain-containing protein
MSSPKSLNVLTLVLLSGVILSLVCTSHGQNVPKKLHIQADYAIFHRNEMAHLEIYYAIPQSQLSFHPGSAAMSYVGSAIITLNIFKNDTALIAGKAWKMECAARDPTKINSLSVLVDQLRYELEPGTYRLTLKARDVERVANLDSIALSVLIPQYSVEDLHSSNLELCSSIKPVEAGEKSVFDKSNHRVIPNPSNLFTAENPVVFYYVEVYNLLKQLAGSYYLTRLSVTDNRGEQVHSVRVIEKKKVKSINSSVEMGAVNISSLPSGVYYLSFSIVDSVGRTCTSSTKKFFIFNPPVQQQKSVADRVSTASLASELAGMSEEQLDKEFDCAAYIASSEEKSAYDKLSGLIPKRDFVFTFWKSRQGNVLEGSSNFRSAYLARIQYASEQFRALGRDGWKTDRGRVLAIYGFPDDIERVPSSFDIKPYETWTYHRFQSGVIFVFGDLSGFNDYRLLHSTALGEPKDENWLGQLQTR